jgi:predicted PurR-regulated permease PerM
MSLPSPSPRQSRLLWLAITGLAAAVLACLLVGLVWGLGELLHILSPVLWPLAVSGVLAYLLDPLVDYFERKRVPRQRAIILVFGIAVGLFLGLLSSIVPQVVTESKQLAEQVPAYVDKVQKSVAKWIKDPPELVKKYLKSLLKDGKPGAATPDVPGPATNSIPASSTNALASPTATSPSVSTNEASVVDLLLGKVDPKLAGPWAVSQGQKVGKWLFGQFARVASFFGFLAGLALVPVYAFYFLLEKKGIESKWTDYLPIANSEAKNELVFVLKSINDCLIVFFRSQVLVAICDGILYTIGFLIIGLPYSILLGVMATVLTMIPFLGAIATCATALVIAFAQNPGWQGPLGVVVVFAIVQTLEGFVIQPKIMGDRIGLHPLTIIVALMFGTTLLGGILGGILAIPLTAAGRVLMFRYVWKRPDARAGG